jgi:hypothetical protein
MRDFRNGGTMRLYLINFFSFLVGLFGGLFLARSVYFKISEISMRKTIEEIDKKYYFIEKDREK